MKKNISIFLILALLGSLFSGCVSQNQSQAHVPTGDALFMEGDDLEEYLGEDEEEPQEISLVYYPDRSMNPLIATSYTNRTLFSLIYQGLFASNADFEPVPILCKSYQVSPSNLTWTFYLEDTACFSDGSPLTIEDVLATYEAAKESDYYKGRFTHINSMSLSDDGGISFVLNTPYENLPILLDIPIIKAEEVEAEHPLGSGPYIFSGGLSGAHLRKNLNWWCNIDIAVTADSVPLVEAFDQAQVRDEFEFYDVGLVCADPLSDNYADFRCDYELWDCDNGVFVYLACNIRYSEYFEDDTIRKALTYAIDREKIVEDNYRGYAMPATLCASPASPYYSETLAEKYAYDPMKFMSAIGTLPAREEPLQLLVNSDDSARVRTARDIAETLTELGLETVTVEVSTLVFRSRVEVCNYDMYLGQTRLPPNMDLSEFFRPWGSLSWGLGDCTGIYPSCQDALANQGNYYTLHEKVAEDGRIIPVLFGSYAVYGKRGLLTGLTPGRDNVFCYDLGKTLENIKLATEY